MKSIAAPNPHARVINLRTSGFMFVYSFFFNPENTDLLIFQSISKPMTSIHIYIRVFGSINAPIIGFFLANSVTGK